MLYMYISNCEFVCHVIVWTVIHYRSVCIQSYSCNMSMILVYTIHVHVHVHLCYIHVLCARVSLLVIRVAKCHVFFQSRY